MEEESLGQKIVGAIKWSTITEIIAKLVSPITNMILARLLVPEAFEVIVIVNMVVLQISLVMRGFKKF